MKLSDLLNGAIDFENKIDGIDKSQFSLNDDLANRNVNKVVTDHRKVDSESIFIALVGTEVDSHAFISEVRDKNAAYIIGQAGATSSVEPDLWVRNSRACIGPMASILEGQPSRKMSIVGITGTNGKTSVSYLYSAMIQSQHPHCFTMGTTGILLDGEKESDSQTTPDPLLLQKTLGDFLRKNVGHGAMEVSSHALDQYRVLGTRFSAVAFTNFSQDHLDYHKEMSDYFEAKAQLFSKEYADIAVINVDDEKGDQILDRALQSSMRVISVSTKNEDQDVFVRTESEDVNGTSGEISVKLDDAKRFNMKFQTTMIGDFNMENIAVAIGLAKANNLDLKECVESLADFITVPGRMQRPDSKKEYSVFVDYAHTPDALSRVLNVVRPLAKNLIVVFGCGGDRDKTKRPIMGKIASEIADQIIVTNDNPRSEDPNDIASQITEGLSSKVEVILDRYNAIQHAIASAKPGDAVVIAGKGHEIGQVFADRQIEFSDLGVAKEIMDRN